MGWYFVPIFNLFRPYGVMAEMWKASNPKVDSTRPEAWRSIPTPGVVKAWWTLNVVGNFEWLLFIPVFSTAFLHGFHGASGFDNLNNSGTTSYIVFVSILLNLIGIAGLILTFRVVRELSELQEEKERAMFLSETGAGN